MPSETLSENNHTKSQIETPDQKVVELNKERVASLIQDQLEGQSEYTATDIPQYIKTFIGQQYDGYNLHTKLKALFRDMGDPSFMEDKKQVFPRKTTGKPPERRSTLDPLKLMSKPSNSK